MTSHKTTHTTPTHTVSPPTYAPGEPSTRRTENRELTCAPGNRTSSTVLEATEAVLRLRKHVTKRISRCLYNSRRLCHRLQICERRRNRRSLHTVRATAKVAGQSTPMRTPSSPSTPLVSSPLPRRVRKRKAEEMMNETRLDSLFVGDDDSQQEQSHLRVSSPAPVSPTPPNATTTSSPKRRRLESAAPSTHAEHLVQLSSHMERESIDLANRTSQLRTQIGSLSAPLSSTQRRLQHALSPTTAANLLQLASDMERQSVALAERGRHLRVEITRELGAVFEEVNGQAGGVELTRDEDAGRPNVAGKLQTGASCVLEPSTDVDGAERGSRECGSMVRAPDSGDVTGGVDAGASACALRKQTSLQGGCEVEEGSRAGPRVFIANAVFHGNVDAGNWL